MARSAEEPWSRHAFLLTDIEGSTRRWEADPESMSVDLAHHDAVLQSAVRDAGGTMVKSTGDGFLFEFGAPIEAASAAMRSQGELSSSSWPHAELAVRMGIHVGDAQSRAGDFYGPTLNRCARLMGAAAGGQILATREVVEEVAAEASLADRLHHHGSCRLRDLGEPIEVWEILHDVRTSPTRPSALDGTTNNLPFVASSFVGHHDDLREIERLLAERHLVTLTGSGGVGKTRLALQVAARVSGGYPDGTWFVALEGVEDDDEVCERVMAVLGVRPIPGVADLERLAERLRSSRTLLVLDCCEHVLDGVCELVEAIASDDIRILATSRNPLGVQGELVRRVRSLHTSGGSGEPSSDPPEAVRLLAERISERDVSVDLSTPDAVAAAERITQRLDGIPLAIELAAARLGALDLASLEQKLAEGLPLADGSSVRPPRHRTIEATIEWSDRLLSAGARRLLHRLTVFESPPDLEAVESVAAGPEGLEVVDALDELIDASLVSFSADPDAPRRFMMLDAVHAYATDRWDEDDRRDTEQRHVAWAAGLAAAGGPQVHMDAGWLGRLSGIDADLTRAISLLFDSSDDRALAMAADLAVYWVVTGQAQQGRLWLDQAMSEASEASGAALARLTEGAGIAAALDADYERSDQLLARAASLFEGLGRARRAAYPTFWRARSTIVRSFQGAATDDELSDACKLLDSSIGALRSHGDALGQVLALPYVGWARMLAGAEDPKGPILEALDMVSAPGLERVAAYARAHLAHVVLVVDNDPLEAAGLLGEAIHALREAGDRQNLLICLLLLTAVELRLARDDQAWSAITEAAAIADSGGANEWEPAVVAVGWAVAARRDPVLSFTLCGYLEHSMPAWRRMLENTGLGPVLAELDQQAATQDDLVRRTAASAGSRRSTQQVIGLLAHGGAR